MTDFNAEGEVIVADNRLEGARAWCHVMYALHALSALAGILTTAFVVTAFVFGWPSILAVIINYVTRDQVRNTWLESHWRWQLRTFWFAALWLAVAGLLAITIIGIPFAWALVVGSGLWVLYRVVRGWMALSSGASLPLPD